MFNSYKRPYKKIQQNDNEKTIQNKIETVKLSQIINKKKN